MNNNDKCAETSGVIMEEIMGESLILESSKQVKCTLVYILVTWASVNIEKQRNFQTMKHSFWNIAFYQARCISFLVVILDGQKR